MKLKTRTKHCGYGYIEESANELLARMEDNEKYFDLKVVPLSDIVAVVILVYAEGV